MSTINWNSFQQVSQCVYAREWLQIQLSLCLAPNTVKAYGYALDDYLRFCAELGLEPTLANKSHVASYVRHLTERPTLQGKKGLANATIQQRVTVIRLYYDYLLDEGICDRNPVATRRYTAPKGFGGNRSRSLIRHYKKLPWIPTEEQWHSILQAVREESLRNRLMFALSYDGALRREEICSLEKGDIDPTHQLITIRAEVAKNHCEKLVCYTDAAAQLLAAYMRYRQQLSSSSSSLFLSESRRNYGQPISIWTWTKVIEAVAERAGIPQFTTHTLRHLRLTDLARAGCDLYKISQYAGHQNIEVTKQYIHLSGREVIEAFQHGMAAMQSSWDELLEAKNRNEDT